MSLRGTLTPSEVHCVETCVRVCMRVLLVIGKLHGQRALHGLNSKPSGTCLRDRGSRDRGFSFPVYLTKQVDSWRLEND